MPIKTPNLDLYKVNGETDGNDTFNVDVVLNDNWDKIDAAVGNIKVDIPDASLAEKGIVQLSNATNGTRENVAVTEKAVNDAALQAKSYTDQQISLVTETGIPKLVSYPLLVTATADNQKVFEIPLDIFDANTDTLLVAINRAVLDSTQYTVTNTVRNEAGEVTQRAKITLLSGVASTSEVTMVVLKNVPIGPEGTINGAVMAVNSVPINRVNGLEDQLDEVFQSVSDGKTAIAAAITDKGVAASGSDTFPVLADKIGQITTGIKSVKGTLPGYSSGSITNLPIKPEIVLIYASIDEADVSLSGYVCAYLDGSSVVYVERISGGTGGRSTSLSLINTTFGKNYVNFNMSRSNSKSYAYIVFGV